MLSYIAVKCRGFSLHSHGPTLEELKQYSSRIVEIVVEIVEIDKIKEKQKQLENTNADLEKSLEFAQKSSERVVA